MQPKKNSIIKTLKLSKKKILVFIFFVAALVASFLFVLKDIPESATIGANNYPQSTKIYDRNGTIVSEGVFKNDKYDEQLKDYYQTGKIRSIDTYQNGRSVKIQLYDEEGKETLSQDISYTEKPVILRKVKK